MHTIAASRLSVDFGNVLVQNISREYRPKIFSLCASMRNENDTEKLDQFLLSNSSLVPNAINGLQKLITINGVKNIFIVSRASGLERFVNCRLFIIHRFANLTGFLPEHLFFVNKYHEKAGICRSLNIKTHIDDRGEVLFHLKEIVPNLIWFSPKSKDVSRWSDELSSRAMRVNGWNELLSLL